MKTNVLLATALLIVTSAQAQVSNIYSQNIVGHVSYVYPAGALACIASPLDDGSNTLDSVLANVPAKSTVQMWNGTGYTASIKGTSWSPALHLKIGDGFFINGKSGGNNWWQCLLYQ